MIRIRHRLFRDMMMLLAFTIGSAMEIENLALEEGEVAGGEFHEEWLMRKALLEDSDSSTMTLQSAQGQVFEMKKSTAVQCKKLFLDQELYILLNEDYADNSTLELFIKYMEYHAQNGLPPKLNMPLNIPHDSTGEQLEGCEGIWRWDAKFMDQLNNDQVFNLLSLANFLDHSALLELCTAKVASKIKGQTEEQIYKNFDIPDDDPPSEAEMSYVTLHNMHWVEPERYERRVGSGAQERLDDRIAKLAHLIQRLLASSFEETHSPLLGMLEAEELNPTRRTFNKAWAIFLRWRHEKILSQLLGINDEPLGELFAAVDALHQLPVGSKFFGDNSGQVDALLLDPEISRSYRTFTAAIKSKLEEMELKEMQEHLQRLHSTVEYEKRRRQERAVARAAASGLISAVMEKNLSLLPCKRERN